MIRTGSLILSNFSQMSAAPQRPTFHHLGHHQTVETGKPGNPNAEPMWWGHGNGRDQPNDQ